MATLTAHAGGLLLIETAPTARDTDAGLRAAGLDPDQPGEHTSLAAGHGLTELRPAARSALARALSGFVNEEGGR